MDNIVRVYQKKRTVLDFLEGWGCIIIILIGIVGCTKICNNYNKEWDGLIFGFSMIGVGILFSKLMNYCISRLNKKDEALIEALVDALKSRRLSNSDLKGLDREELERLRLHIYAMNGYNFNVNDGLYYLEGITKEVMAVWSLSEVSFGYSNFDYYSRMFGCSNEQLDLALGGYNEFRRAPGEDKVTRTSGIIVEKLSEAEKDSLRETVEAIHWTEHLFNPHLHVGDFNRNGEYGHEGHFYYDFKECNWYKPTTSNLDEVYSKMSEIEKYNVEFIKAREDDMN